jgi:DNA-binding MarR family transcriptional regulator
MNKADIVTTPAIPECARVAQALKRLNDIHPEMTVRQAIALMKVAAYPGIKQRELRQDIGRDGKPAADSVASRVLAVLSDVGIGGLEGLGLVDMTPSREDRREKLLTLSDKGLRIIGGLFGRGGHGLEEGPRVVKTAEVANGEKAERSL